MNTLSAALLFALLSVTTLACGGDPDPTTGGEDASLPTGNDATPEMGEEMDETIVGPPDVAWADMTRKQRGTYMKEKVTPKMKELFTTFDAEEFADFSCKTCHGPGAEDHSFEMPNAELFELPATSEGFQALATEKPEMLEFMSKTVKPEMALLLGLPEFDPSAPSDSAVGCGTCHTRAAAE